MAKNKSGRPEWFKFWRRNRDIMDIEKLSMESRGKVFTNIMRYFDGDVGGMLNMTPSEKVAFNMLKQNTYEFGGTIIHRIAFFIMKPLVTMMNLRT